MLPGNDQTLMTITMGPWQVSAVWLLIAVITVAFWLGCRYRFPRWRGVLAAVASCAVIAWCAAGIVTGALGKVEMPLPEIDYMTPNGRPLPIKLPTNTLGQPIKGTVVNLWATWCGPCRREMPAFARAQARYPELRFIFANQGENAAAITGYLEAQNLHLNNVVLDPDRTWMQRFHSSGIPTTLFFDTDGKLVASRIGELSDTALDAELSKLQQAR